MKKRNRKTRTLLCLCAAVLVGCTDESDYGRITGVGEGIGFEVTLSGSGEETAQTRSTTEKKFEGGEVYLRTTVTKNEDNPFTVARIRATELTTDNFAKNCASFGAYAYVYDNQSSWEGGSSSSTIYIDGGTVECTRDIWQFSPTRYWPSDKKLTFFAYAPMALDESVDGTNDGSLMISTNDNSNLPQIVYTVPSSYEKQKDIVVAIALDQTGTDNNNVELKFNHILTAVQVKCGADIPAGVIKKVTISGSIKNSGTYDMNNRSWTLDDSEIPVSYEVAVEGDDGIAVGQGEPVNIVTDGFTLMLLPQQLAEDVKIEITYIPENGTEETLWAYLNDEGDEQQEWNSGAKVVYRIYMDDGSIKVYNAVGYGWF